MLSTIFGMGSFLFTKMLLYYPFFMTVFFTIIGVLMTQSLLIILGVVIYFIYKGYFGEKIHDEVIRIKDYTNMDGYKFEIIDYPDELPDKKYIFCSHPHGVFNMSIFMGLLGDYANFSEKYPHINLRVITLPILFKFPIISQIMSMLGLGSSNREFISELLDLGKSPVVLAGGVHEMLYGGTKKIPVNISKRYGIFKMSQEKNIKIVPILTKNENDNYSYWHIPINKWLLENLGIIIPIAWGKHLIFPRNTEYEIILGNPINPTDKTVDEIKKEYIEELERLAKKHNLELEII